MQIVPFQLFEWTFCNGSRQIGPYQEAHFTTNLFRTNFKAARSNLIFSSRMTHDDWILTLFTKWKWCLICQGPIFSLQIGPQEIAPWKCGAQFFGSKTRVPIRPEPFVKELTPLLFLIKFFIWGSGQLTCCCPVFLQLSTDSSSLPFPFCQQAGRQAAHYWEQCRVIWCAVQRAVQYFGLCTVMSCAIQTNSAFSRVQQSGAMERGISGLECYLAQS